MAAVLVGLFVCLAWATREPPHVAGGDDLVYHALSRSIDAGSYRSIYDASEPLHVKYPPAYPAWMSLVRAIGGEHPDVISAANLLLAAAALVLTYVVARGLLGPVLALAVLLLSALSPAVQWSASWYSESAFFFATTAALFAASRADRPRTWYGYVVIACAILAFLTRLAALPLVGAAGLWVLSRRRRGELIAFAVAAVVSVGGWGAYSTLAASPGIAPSYVDDIDRGGMSVSQPGAVARIASRIVSNATAYATGALPTELGVPTVRGTRVDNIAWLAVIALLLAVGLTMLWRAWWLATLFLVGSGALFLLWPWPLNRLLYPLIPLLLIVLLLGAQRLGSQLPRGVRVAALSVLVGLLAVGGAGRTAERWRAYPGCDRGNAFGGNGCHDAPARSIVAAANHLRQHAPRDAIVASMAEPGVFYLTGRRSQPLTFIEGSAPGDAARALSARGVDYVLLTIAQPNERAAIANALHASCHELALVARFEADAMLLAPTPPAAGEDACNALGDFVRARRDAPGA